MSLDDLPLDWSIKQTLRVESEQPMGWLQYKFSSVASFYPAHARETSDMNEEERLARALIQWRYPSNASQPSTREPVQKSKAEEKVSAIASSDSIIAYSG